MTIFFFISPKKIYVIGVIKVASQLNKYKAVPL